MGTTGMADFSSRSSDVKLVALTKKFKSLDGSGEVTAVNDVDLQISSGELVTILGPSGCGKTTTLRMVAGFEFPTSGSILIGGRDIATVPPNKRGISMVFQSYALFPHLTIYENVAYGLRVKKLSPSAIDEKTKSVLDLMQLTPMSRRYPNQVSGGQQQRIALARAIVIEPSVLLFDEPLSNLDAKLREYMRDELRKLQKRLGITGLYVTHDQDEAMAISDRIVIMQDGFVRQVGTPRQIYEKPMSKFVANFMGKANFVPATLKGREGRAAIVELAGGLVRVPEPGDAVPKDGEVALVVRPESVTLSAPKTGSALLSGRIDRRTYFGSLARYEMDVGGMPLLAECGNPKDFESFGEGSVVGVGFDLDRVRILAAE